MASILASAAAPFLEKALNKWLNVDGRIDTSGGKLRLRRVAIREDAFDELALPVALRGGLIEEVEIDIPWAKLHKDSVVIRLHQPLLLLAPHSENEWDTASERRRSATRKAKELQQLRESSAPLSRADAASAPALDDGEKSNFLEKLVAKLFDNAQLLITGALIRYEDYSHAGTPFAFEIAFDSLWVHPEHITAPEPGSEHSSTAKGPSGALAHREALVCALCAYSLDAASLPPTAQLTPCATLAEIEERLRSSGVALDAPVALRSNARRCCLAPLSFAAELASRRLDEPSLPQHVCCLETGRIQIELSATELGWIASTLAYMKAFDATDVHRSFRPPLAQRPLNHAAEWWRFAGAAVRWQRQQAREQYTWRAVLRRGKQRRAFAHLHKKVLLRGLEKLSEPERVSYTQLCDGLSAADQILFERIAIAQLSGEQAQSGEASPVLRRRGTGV